MKILYVIPGTIFGGAHNQVVQLVPYLSTKGIDSVVLLPREAGNAPSVFEQRGVSFHQVTMRRIRSPRHLRKNLLHLLTLPAQVIRLKRLFQSLSADVVQIHGITQVDVAVAARLAQLPIIWQLLDTRAPLLLSTLFRPALQRLPAVIMCTGWSTLLAHMPNRNVRPPVIPYFPPPRKDLVWLDEENRASARSRLGVAQDSTLVVSIGNLNPQKGYRTLLEAVSQAGPNISLRIRGSESAQHPGYFEGLQEIARERGLNSRTVSTMEADLDVPEVLAAADIFCLASEANSEGLPTILLEAMTVGIPVIASNVGSISELVRNRVDGVLCGPGQVADFAREITSMSLSANVRAGYARRSRSRAASIAAEWDFEAANIEAIELATSMR